MNSIIASKKHQAQAFLNDGGRIPVTKIQAGPCLITQIKDKDKDGYQAVQLSFGKTTKKNKSKPLLGHLKKALPDNDYFPRLLKEVKTASSDLKVGDQVIANQVLKPGDIVDVAGISKGKGFTGVMKRWGFKGGPRTHGQSDRPRAPGSIGQTTTPGRVYKGKKMAGRSGGKRVTIRNLLVIKVEDGGEVWLKGQVPGPFGSPLIVKKVSEAKEFSGLVSEGSKNQDKIEKKEKKDNKEKNQPAKSDENEAGKEAETTAENPEMISKEKTAKKEK